MSTTFSRKKRISQPKEKRLKTQCDFRTPREWRCLRASFGNRNNNNLSIPLTRFKENKVENVEMFKR